MQIPAGVSSNLNMPLELGNREFQRSPWWVPIVGINPSGQPQIVQVEADGSIAQSPDATPASTGDYATQTGADSVLSYVAAGAGVSHILSGVVWSYSGVATTPSDTAPGTLTVSDGSNVVRSIDITSTGPGFLNFQPAIKGTANTAMTVTLTDGGSGVVGKINAQHSTT